MLTSRYMVSVKNLPAILEQIRRGTAPDIFNTEHLKSVGFASSNDRAIIPLLRDLGFLNDSNVPTSRYHVYRDESQSSVVLGEALREAYGDLFHVNANPSDKDRRAIEGKFKAVHNVTDRVAQQQTSTFLALLKLADLTAPAARAEPQSAKPPVNDPPQAQKTEQMRTPADVISLRYNIEVHLPATKEIEVYNAIFKSLRSNLLD